MVRQSFALLLLLLSLLGGTVLAAPVLASDAHVGVVAVSLAEEMQHGHVHAGDLSSQHNAVDHAHDVPHTVSTSLMVPSPPRAEWVDLAMVAVRRDLDADYERPPRQHP